MADYGRPRWGLYWREIRRSLALLSAAALMVVAGGVLVYLLEDVVGWKPPAEQEDTIVASPGAVFVIDGDTVRYRGENLRLLTIDAPEIRDARCEEERRAGIAARERLAALLSGKRVSVHYSGHRDRYDRPLVSLSVDGKDVADVLTDEGHALTGVRGKTLSGIHWCGLW
jgi:endonuclease YncB( thermonuclease family)